MSGKRDNAYFMQALKKKHMHLVVEILAGRMTVSQARKLAGMGGKRTRLHELKNAWGKATDAERHEFLKWAREGLPVPTPTAAVARPREPAFSADRRMMPWAKTRILEIMDRRRLTSSNLAVELGLRPLDFSVMKAVRRDSKVKDETVTAVTDWLARCASV